MFQRRSLVFTWGAFLLVAFGLLNSCATHREMRQMGSYLAKGTWQASPALLFRVLRALGTDDGDMSRYLAYSRAILGKPYQSHYVRPLEQWRQDAKQFDTGKDVDDPNQSPPTVPTRPLIPYKDFLVEYPPGFFLFSIPPALLAAEGGLDRYSVWFGSLMALLLTASLALCTRVARLSFPQASPTKIVLWMTLCMLALGTITMRRYDAALSFSLSLLVYGCVTRRPILAGAALALGIVAKGLPILIAPLPVLYYLSMRRWRELAIASVSGVLFGLLIGLPFTAAAGRQILDMFSYHGMRPLQIESTGAALLALSHVLFGTDLVVVFTYGSMNVVGTGESLLRTLSAVLPFASLVAVWLWSFVALRRATNQPARDRILILAICLILVGQMALGKVFSPQYLTWLLPLGILATVFQDYAGRWLLFTASALTFLVFPISYHLSLAGSLSPLFGSVLLLRNLCLLAWAVRLISAWRGGSAVPIDVNAIPVATV